VALLIGNQVLDLQSLVTGPLLPSVSLLHVAGSLSTARTSHTTAATCMIVEGPAHLDSGGCVVYPSQGQLLLFWKCTAPLASPLGVTA
jgi:hypothetical protein